MHSRDARFVWNRLNGIACLYKPPLAGSSGMKHSLLLKLTGELNELECRPQRPHVEIVGDTSEKLTVDVRPSYADHPLVVGPRYLSTETKAAFVKTLGHLTSGVCVMGINRGTRTSFYLRKCNLVSTYRITGQFGLLTDDKTSTGKIIFRCRSKYLKRHNIDKIAASIEAKQKKSIFALTGIHPQSQAAYDMLSEGICRPVLEAHPLIYSLKCIEFNEPYFTVEVVSANESELFLLDIVSQIGYGVKNVAVTTSIQCIRCGYFSLEDALLKKHWTLQNIIDNIARCDKILKSNREFSEYLKQVEKEEMARVDAYENDLSEERREYEEEAQRMKKKI